MAFKKATKQNATIKLAITGTSGSGKTYSALRLAKGLGGKTALLDTEYGSASLYADKFDFDTWDESDPHGFPPEYFIKVIHAAEEAGYKNLIIDSLSHEWSGRGGCLELVDAVARAKYKGNSYTAWNEITPRHNKLIEAIVGSKMNIIATMRAKSEYVLNKDERTGKSSPQKVGLGSVQRDGTDYEFTLMFELDRDSHLASVGKDRTSLFKDPIIITEDTGKEILNWLSTEQPIEEPKPEKKKQNPNDYVLSDFNDRRSNGETQESIISDYSELLQMDIPDFKELSADDIRTLAIALFNRNKQQKEQINA